MARLLAVQFVISLITFIPASGSAQVERLRLALVKQYQNPVITIDSPGAEGNKHGFEGGRVIKLGATYHLFVSEMAGDPSSVKMKLAHWTSEDRLQWKRVSTLFESSGEFEGKDPRAALWAPMPNEVNGRWYGFYGSADSGKLPMTFWGVGLASAPDLAGPWKRLPRGNPLPIEKVFVENPVVTKLNDGTSVAVFDTDINNPNAIGYALSPDGVHWSRGVRLVVQPRGKGFWADVVRTPLGLIPEGDGTFTLFYTGYKKTGSKLSDASGPGAGAIGLVTLKLLQDRQ